jgi:carboxymethylenebutenolidase
MTEPAIKNEKVDVAVADGTRMAAYVSAPDRPGPHPALLLFQEAFGVNHHIRDVADRFAREGYVVIAPELFHRTAPVGFEVAYTDFDAVRPHIQAITPANLENDIRASYGWLRSNERVDANQISCVGFCLGGRASFIANSTVNLHAAVSFYGGGIAPALLDRVPRQQSPLLLIWGGLDKHITPEVRGSIADALTAAQKNFVNAEFSKATDFSATSALPMNPTPRSRHGPSPWSFCARDVSMTK